MRTRSLLVVLMLVLAATPAAAQWDSPSFFSPRPGEDIGLYLIDGDGDDLGVAGIWRQSGNLNLGVRAGIAGDAFSLGAEFYGPLGLGGSAPLLLAWNLGAGATFGDNVTAVRIPLGVSIGALLGSGSLRIMPYIHPRVAFDLVSREIGDDEDTDTDLELPIDIGADFIINPSFVLRLGGTFNDGSAFGVGIAYRMGRTLVVR